MSSERSKQNLQRDNGEHDHRRETGLAVVTRRNLRALSATPQRPVFCTLTPGPARGRTQANHVPPPC